MNVVKTENGYVSGTINGEYGKEVSIFRGIPYAAPPVGELRWKPPQPAASWNGIRECTQFSLVAPQVEVPGISPILPMSEDCLYLNVVTPAKETAERLPVMVWMHGGGYSSGCGNDRIWNYHRLPQYGVVVVSVNTRLDLMGLLAHPLLSEESPYSVSGNYLFLDLIAALHWVQRNVASFGGDPDNVTIFGESGGGAKVANMMASPLAKGLFHRAMCESGTAWVVFLGGKPLKELEVLGEEVFAELGLDRTANPLKGARELPWEKILKAWQVVEGSKHLKGPSILLDAAVDGWYLPQRTDSVFTAGRHNAVPLLVCANLGELTGPGPVVIPQLIPSYINMIECGNQAGVTGYACIFDQVPAGWKQEGGVCAHSMELPYVFGDWDDTTGWWTSVSTAARGSGAKSSLPGLTKIDKKVSEAMMKLWTQFARTGDPNSGSLPIWPAYHRDTDQYLYISGQIEARSGFSKIVP